MEFLVVLGGKCEQGAWNGVQVRRIYFPAYCCSALSCQGDPDYFLCITEIHDVDMHLNARSSIHFKAFEKWRGVL